MSELIPNIEGYLLAAGCFLYFALPVIVVSYRDTSYLSKVLVILSFPITAFLAYVSVDYIQSLVLLVTLAPHV
ncbi:MAG: hypothetical protein ACJAQS_000461, partial [Porticoccus sp.]